MFNRGIAKRPLFERRTEARFFLAQLARQVRAGRIEVHAYCLMHTHFHILARSPVGELSEAMRRVQSAYVRHFNRNHRRDGGLVRGRFFSKLVSSLEYRRTLVRYVDLNPLRAGLARTSEKYELGSARDYLTKRAGPPWLSRHWVEAEARFIAGVESFEPEAYRVSFGVRGRNEREALAEFMDARRSHRVGEDPFDDLVGVAPPQVRRWMRRKAKLADGLGVGLPACGRGALRSALAEHCEESGAWLVENEGRTWRGDEVAWLGLLRDLTGSSWQQVAAIRGASDGLVRRRVRLHWKLVESDPVYSKRVSRVAAMALRRSLATRAPRPR